ncbi:hypothetical protein M0638_13990 [Roseomonas sp. NAR14]|uniref:Uncharacterized protein n=1 Tax=Roseomonas acroporae TaxID=2937791 RepID=A0A9X1Y8L5_9PROT|nr:hypothetical protein [Roseomonas acroporae]MCK8785496.1 hypothetical protein [Roseomonas acroporae]
MYIAPYHALEPALDRSALLRGFAAPKDSPEGRSGLLPSRGIVFGLALSAPFWLLLLLLL